MTPEEARLTARFLRAHPPFDALAADAVERVAACAELESYSAGDVVFGEGAAPVRHLRVIRSGVVELATRGRVLDMLVEGDVFGHGSLLSGLPTAFSARAVEDSTCYRIPAEEARALLSGPAGVTFVARSLLEEPTELHILAREPAVNTADQPVGSLVRGDAGGLRARHHDPGGRAADERRSRDGRRRRRWAPTGSGSSPIVTCARRSSPAG